MASSGNVEIEIEKDDITAESCANKVKRLKAQSGDPKHPYYWDKMLILELIEMLLSLVNLINAFRFLSASPHVRMWSACIPKIASLLPAEA